MLHVAILPSQHPAARIVSIDASAALAMPGVHYVLSGDELAAATDHLMNGLDTPKVQRHPLAVGYTRYAGEVVVAVVADSRALAEDATEKVRVTYEPLPFVINAEAALKPDSQPVHPAHGSNVLLDRTFVWGEVEKHFAETPASSVVPRHLGTQLDRADRDLWRRGVLGSVARHAGCLGLDPDAEISRPDRTRVANPRQLRPRASGTSMLVAATASSAASSRPCWWRIWRGGSAVRCG